MKTKGYSIPVRDNTGKDKSKSVTVYPPFNTTPTKIRRAILHKWPVIEKYLKSISK